MIALKRIPGKKCKNTITLPARIHRVLARACPQKSAQPLPGSESKDNPILSARSRCARRHRTRPKDYSKAASGQIDFRPAHTTCANSLRVGTRRGTPGEGSPRQNSPPDCFVSPPALFYRERISPCAQGDQRLCLWIPPPLKRWTKL